MEYSIKQSVYWNESTDEFEVGDFEGSFTRQVDITDPVQSGGKSKKDPVQLPCGKRTFSPLLTDLENKA